MKLLPPLFLALIYLSLLFLNPNVAKAETIFEDDFNSYAEGSFPTKWLLYGSTCNPNWRVEGGVLKITMGIGCGTHLIPNSLNWSQMQDSYVFDSDIRFISGIDRHFLYRINPTIPFISVLHFAIPGDFGVDADNQNFLTYVGKTYQFNNTYRFRMDVSPTRLKVYLFDFNTQAFELIRDIIFSNPIPAGMIGLGSSPGGGGTTETWFDNVKVTTPSNSLNVPLYKQTDPLWANEIYDSAPDWQTNNRVTIGAIGCGITSAAMVFRYHGLTKMPDGITELTPKSLNDWMNSRLDRNFRNGNTNWESMSKYLSPLLAQINNVQFDSLEYEINSNQDNSILDTNLASGLPVILRVPNHFIVAKGKDTINNSYFINDPFYDKGSLSDYSNQYERMITYVPSNSDLSYMIFAVDPTVDMKLYDGQGNELDSAAVEFPTGDPLQLSTNLVGPLKFIQFAKPESGEYVLKVSANSSVNYLLDGYIYDEGDGTKLFTEKGVVGEGNEDIYNISFHKQNVDESVIENPSVSFDSLLADLDDLYKSGHIARKGSYNYLANKILQAKNYSITNIQRSKDLLLNIRQQLVDDKKRGIDVFASQYLIDQIDVLLTSY